LREEKKGKFFTAMELDRRMTFPSQAPWENRLWLCIRLEPKREIASPAVEYLLEKYFNPMPSF
jgi:hypothetical protein